MISKERLKELIEQKAKIYSTHWQEEVDLSLPCEIVESQYDNKTITHLVVFEDEEHTPSYMIDNLTEDIESAKWQEEFGCIEKLQYLKFPNWKRIENHIEYMRKFGLNHNDRVLARIITSDSIFYFKLCKNLDLFTFELKQTYIGDDLCEQIRDKFPISLGKATKKNYTLACRKAKQLFLEEEE